MNIMLLFLQNLLLILCCCLLNELTANFAIQFSDNFAEYCQLRGCVYFVEFIPKTPSEKLLRTAAKLTALELYKARQENSIQSERAYE